MSRVTLALVPSCTHTLRLLHPLVSCVFTVNFTHPIELVKTRMQVTGDSLGTTVSSLVKNEGPLAFWKGIPFAWGREGSYASIKLGAYAPVRDAIGAGDKNAPFYLKFLAGAITGGVGSIVGNPFDVCKTLAQANSGAAVPLTTLVGNLYRDQGIGGFYRGLQANIGRACVLNATKMGVYDEAKGYVTKLSGWDRKDVRCVVLWCYGDMYDVVGYCCTHADILSRIHFQYRLLLWHDFGILHDLYRRSVGYDSY